MNEITLTCKLGLKNPNFQFLPFLAAQKFIAKKEYSYRCHLLNFHRKLSFLNALNNVLYQNQ